MLLTETLFETLESSLLAQHRYLLERNMVEVESSARQLRDHVDRIHLNALRRNQLLSAQGLPADEQGMRVYLHGLPVKQRRAVEQQWQDLESRIGRCRELNTINGRLQGRLRAVTGKLFELIWGQIPGRAYNRFGHMDKMAAPKNISDA